MSKHYTVRVNIMETQHKEVDQYGKVTKERTTDEIASMVITADSLADAHQKVRAVMAGALPLPKE